MKDTKKEITDAVSISDEELEKAAGGISESDCYYCGSCNRWISKDEVAYTGSFPICPTCRRIAIYIQPMTSDNSGT